MPGFDRVITISWGSALDPTVIKAWAAAFDLGNGLLPNGTITHRRNYNIRYNETVLRQNPAQMRIIDEFGDTWSIESIQETPRRRQMLFIQCYRESNVPS